MKVKKEQPERPDCRKCEHENYCLGSSSDNWEERVAICMANGVPERRSWIIACVQCREAWNKGVRE